MELKCSVCNKTISPNYVKCLSLQNDSIYFTTTVTKELYDEYSEMHVAPISKELKTNPNFMYHIQAYKDSLCNDSICNMEFLDFFNKEEEYDHYARVKKLAPFGYIEVYGYSNYGNNHPISKQIGCKRHQIQSTGERKIRCWH